MRQSNSTKLAKIRLVDAMLKDISPSLYQVCEDTVNPVIYDVNQLPIILDLLKDVKEPKTDNLAFYCAVIYKLYSPAQLYITGIRLPNGLRKRFIDYFGYVHEPIWNHWADPVRTLMKNPRFANEVNVTASNILTILKNSGGNQSNFTKTAPFPHPSQNVEVKPSE